MHLLDTEDDNVTDLELARVLIKVLARLLNRIGPTPTPRGKLRILYLQETSNMAWKFSIGLPALPEDSAKIASAELTVQVGDATPSVQTLEKDVDLVEGFTGPAEANVKRTLVYIGTNGKRGDALVVESLLPPSSTPPTPVGDMPLTDLVEVADPTA